jgi:hypothetical protein
VHIGPQNSNSSKSHLGSYIQCLVNQLRYHPIGLILQREAILFVLFFLITKSAQFCWFVAGRVLVRFLQAALDAKSLDQISTLRAEIDFVQ